MRIVVLASAVPSNLLVTDTFPVDRREFGKGRQRFHQRDDTSFLSIENIFKAYRNARKSRKESYEVYLFDQNREEYLLRMREELLNGRYSHGSYRNIILKDSKKRYISSPSFRDHILHHLVYQEIYEILDTKMVHSTFACRRWFGHHRGCLYLRDLIRTMTKNTPGDLFYLKLDFSKYFFSIHQDRLKKKLRKHIHNEPLLVVIDKIIESYQSPDVYDELLQGCDFYRDEPNKWLPIGGILSQLFANYYCNDLDQYIKHTLKLRFIRYMDDIIVLGTKEELQNALRAIAYFSKQERLILHPHKISFHKVSDGVNFIGYRIRDEKIYAGKRIRLSFQKFMDRLTSMSLYCLKLNEEEVKRIESMYHSRAGWYKITDFGDSYIQKRGGCSIHPWR